MEDIGFTKSQLFFVSQPFTVYEVDFLNLDMILDGFKTGNHSVWTFFPVLPKSGVLNPNSDYFFRL